LKQPLEDRQDERGGLAGAGFGARDQVRAAAGDRDDLVLDLGRGPEAALADPAQQGLREPEGLERRT
jgi:hypothetical protein